MLTIAGTWPHVNIYAISINCCSLILFTQTTVFDQNHCKTSDVAGTSLVKLLTSTSHTGALLSVVMHEIKLTLYLPLWARSTFFTSTDRMFLILTQYKWMYQDHTQGKLLKYSYFLTRYCWLLHNFGVPGETSQFLASLCWIILPPLL